MAERSELSKKDQVRNYLIQELQSGKYPKGSVFLSENTLIQRLGICKNTVREAYSSLVSDGLLDNIPGVEKEEVFAEIINQIAVRKPDAMAEEIMRKSLKYNGDKPSDDMTVLVLGLFDTYDK